MRVLSIDWDYFVEATMDERVQMFPDGNDNLDYQISDFIWTTHYADPNLSEIRVNSDLYNRLKGFIHKFKHSISFAESHKEIYPHLEAILENDPSDTLEIVNVDFHHDMYHYGGDTLNCGNWARLITEKYPERVKYVWVGREDSETELITGDIVEMSPLTLKEVLEGDFDYLFVCRSDAWSPPHLDEHFKELIAVAPNFKEYEDRVNECRRVEIDILNSEKAYVTQILRTLNERKVNNDI